MHAYPTKIAREYFADLNPELEPQVFWEKQNDGCLIDVLFEGTHDGALRSIRDSDFSGIKFAIPNNRQKRVSVHVNCRGDGERGEFPYGVNDFEMHLLYDQAVSFSNEIGRHAIESCWIGKERSKFTYAISHHFPFLRDAGFVFEGGYVFQKSLREHTDVEISADTITENLDGVLKANHIKTGIGILKNENKTDTYAVVVSSRKSMPQTHFCIGPRGYKNYQFLTMSDVHFCTREKSQRQKDQILTALYVLREFGLRMNVLTIGEMPTSSTDYYASTLLNLDYTVRAVRPMIE